ncbi:hypothetical protein DND01_21570 [Escherichia albertii]|nr:hypothetical protein [Escherichia albertii]
MIKKYALILNVLYQFLLMKSSIFIFLSIEKFYANTCYISNMKFQKTSHKFRKKEEMFVICMFLA